MADISADKLADSLAKVLINPGIEFDPDVAEILPIPDKENILITSALPYVNNVPHLGNIIGSVLSADVFSRYKKARGVNTLFICGTDEYGTATETKALEDGVTPQELCDKYHVIHKEVYDWFQIKFDKFGRTTTPLQTEIAQDIFLDLDKNGYLEEQSMTQLYCEKHEGFLADRFVEGTCPRCNYEDARGDQCDSCGNLLDPFELINPRCKIDGSSPVPKKSNHIFLKLDTLQPELEKWVQKSNAAGEWSRNGKTITDAWMKEGLHPRCITRDLKWGTPVPLKNYENKVLYVWFDACIGYVSITANYTDKWRLWWNQPEHVKLYQFMGKDNVPFHTVVFPSSQIGTKKEWTMLHHISTTEYLQYEGGKFSKSRNVGVFGNNAQDTGVPADVWRYYLLMSRPESADTVFSWRDFIFRNNNELLANLGNFVNRIIKFVNAKYNDTIPQYDVKNLDYEEFKVSVDGILKQYNDHLENVHLRSGLETALQLSARGNLFLQENQMNNTLLAEYPEKAAAVVAVGLNLVYLLSAVIYPYLPETSKGIVEQLNAPFRKIPDEFSLDLLPGHVIGKAKYLFSRIDEKKEDIWRSQFGGGSKVKSEEEKKKEEKKKKKEEKKKKREAAAAAAAAAAAIDGDKTEQDPSSLGAIVTEVTEQVPVAAAATSDTAS
ncbi:tRNA synthetases class I (M)-domain-containing protein [Lipomyces japonicus]|uniref:tRNA synthetases class I (M)-domain-containing protein n=1 Tax=Lipomyces japonicus TaxID=56871 RepID=UPI0034CE0F9D